jgi:phenylacetic acid degradation operon negative regulatory protein
MTTVTDALAGPRHNHLIVTIFGLYGRDGQGTIAIADLIRLLAEVGVDQAGVRSSVSRLKRRGVLESVREGSVAAYRLSPDLEDVFRAGDERIFSPRRANAGDPWILASFSVPESERHVRHRIRTLLTRLGCGQVSPGLWIAAAPIERELLSAVDHAGLGEYVEFFRAAHLTSADPAETVRRWWDLPALDELYRDFLARFASMDDRWRTADPTTSTALGSAFGDYVSLVTAWRRLPYLDPGLPAEYLPEGWSGARAQRLFADLHARLNGPARVFVEGVTAG